MKKTDVGEIPDTKVTKGFESYKERLINNEIDHD